MKWKRKPSNQCVLPATLYRAEKWVLTKAAGHEFAAAQRRITTVVGLRPPYKKTNALREVTKVRDVTASAVERKWA
ncbi:hypothetical protein Y032_0014g2314 [Ancylostoma ceylanicum]|uniref:Uncharacterized protein n=1 Tax=Ancylostoma ceylanicum TaxID=53326 RepID=A0A016VAR9_9BILA|nr:hypothetical protein Y032_0014g2314 [Ancylostoma ceylanicum]